MKSLSSFHLLSFFTTIFLVTVESIAAPTDFNGDGKSEIALVKIVGNSLRWRVLFSPHDEATSQVATVGKPGDHIALGHWTSTESTQAGVITISPNGTDVSWRLESGENRKFGGANDLRFIAGADFDGSGYTDAAYVSRQGKTQVLHVLYDPFAPAGPGGSKDINLGKRTDKIFFLNPDGIKDRIATLRVGKGNKRSKIFIYDVQSGASSRINVGNQKTVPLPLADSNGHDQILAFAKKGATQTTLTLRNTSNGKSFRKVVLQGTGTLIVGDYLNVNSPGHEIAVQTSTGFTIYSPSTEVRTLVHAANDIAVDQININRFGKDNGGNSGGGGGGSGGGGAPGPGLSNVCDQILNADSNVIYKTEVSDHINDARQGGGSFLIESGGIHPSVSCISVYDSEGTEITTYGFYYPPGSGWAARAYGKGLSCAAGENPFSVADEAHANTGSYAGYFKVTDSKCIKISDLRECVNSTNC